jgi:hypothetical protein
MIRKTDIQIDLDAARDVLKRVYPLIDHRDELSVTCRPSAEQPLYDTGWLPEGVKEGDYSVINPEFQGTVIEDLLLSLPFQYGRTRFIRMPGKKCLSIHADPTVRYHCAITTHPDCYIVFKDGDTGTFFHIPADGYLYEMDATRTHTAINARKEERIHLVICSADQ